MAIKLSIDDYAEQIMTDVVSLARAMAVESSNRIVDKSPVQSGSLRGSINAAINSENSSFGDADVTGEATKQSNQSIISKAEAGDEINIVIGAPYFAVIEKGSESRAPMGILLSTGEEIDSILNVAISTKDRYK